MSQYWTIENVTLAAALIAALVSMLSLYLSTKATRTDMSRNARLQVYTTELQEIKEFRQTAARYIGLILALMKSPPENWNHSFPLRERLSQTYVELRLAVQDIEVSSDDIDVHLVKLNKLVQQSKLPDFSEMRKQMSGLMTDVENFLYAAYSNAYSELGWSIKKGDPSHENMHEFFTEYGFDEDLDADDVGLDIEDMSDFGPRK